MCRTFLAGKCANHRPRMGVLGVLVAISGCAASIARVIAPKDPFQTPLYDQKTESVKYLGSTKDGIKSARLVRIDKQLNPKIILYIYIYIHIARNTEDLDLQSPKVDDGEREIRPDGISRERQDRVSSRHGDFQMR